MNKSYKIISLLILVLFIYFLQSFGDKIIHLPGSSRSILALGFLIIAGFLIGDILRYFQFPKLSGYIFTGILFGPYLFNFIQDDMIQGFKLIDSLALNIIAFTAGGEFKFSTVKKRMLAIGSIIGFQILFVLTIVTAVIILSSYWIPFLSSQSSSTVIGIALLFGIIATAKSPAETIAVINETGAKGKMTELIISITVAKDVVVILSFAFVLSLSKTLIIPEASFDILYLLKIFWEIGGSILVGMLIAGIVLLYFRYINTERVLFIIALAFIIAKLSAITHTESILICLTAGIVVENFTKRGESFIKAIEKGSLIIYVIFFVIAGAGLNFNALAESWQLTLIVVFTRLATTVFSTWLGAKVSRENLLTQRYAWTGFLGQAGVSLGLALIIKKNLPGDIGNYIVTVILAAIAMNQIMGPILFRWGLSRSGEIARETA